MKPRRLREGEKRFHFSSDSGKKLLSFRQKMKLGIMTDTVWNCREHALNMSQGSVERMYEDTVSGESGLATVHLGRVC
jgi:hypothetical protein